MSKAEGRIRAAAALVRLGQAAERGAAAALAGLGAGLGQALNVAERQALTLTLYQRAGGELRALFPWEVQWFAALLPPPPARILVAAAGAGAEVEALVAQGYAVWATEPVERLARQCAARAQVVRAVDHETLAEGILDGHGPAAAWRGERFDAVILGWGSLTHVLSAEGRRRTVRAAAALTAGPVLASFWSASSAGPAPTGAAVALGEALGRRLGRLRGLAPSENEPRKEPRKERFAAWCGFGQLLDRAEVEALGHACGRRVIWGRGAYPHAAWVL